VRIDERPGILVDGPVSVDPLAPSLDALFLFQLDTGYASDRRIEARVLGCP